MDPVVPSKNIAEEDAKKSGNNTSMHELNDAEIKELIYILIMTYLLFELI